MKGLGYLLCLIFYVLPGSGYGQVKNFELDNLQAILLDESSIGTLTSGYWRVFKDETESRGRLTSTAKNTSMCYYPDGSFFYNGSSGTWKILENKYILHEFEKQADQERLNFGGIFSVTALDERQLVVTKLLTSSNDMKRTLHLKPSTILTTTEQPDSGGPYFYDGTLDPVTIDSLSSMDEEALFNAGFTVLPNRSIHIITPDTLYAIRLKKD